MPADNDPLAELRRDRPLLPFLPLIYVAWADGELSAEEATRIRARIEEQDLEPDCRERLGRWLDPQSPPSARQLQAILRTIRRAGGEMSESARGSMAALGAGLVVHSGETAVTEAERRALAALEEALGVAGEEVARELLAETRPAAAEAPPAAGFDPARLRGLLDGRHAELRDRVRRSCPSRSSPTGPSSIATPTAIRCWPGAAGWPTRGSARWLSRPSTAAPAISEVHRRLRDPGAPRPQPAGQVRRPVRALRRQRPAARHRAPPRALSGGRRDAGAARVLRHVRDRARLERRRIWRPSRATTPSGRGVRDPHAGAADRKDWIGNAALHGRMATVFAQLEIDDERLGVHAFLVPIRDEDGAPLPGVEIEDCGLKVGLNGVDNGRLTFDRVRVPRENLLDRFARWPPTATYASPIVSPDRALLHHARHAGRRAHQRRRGGAVGGQDRARDRGALRRRAAASSAPPGRREMPLLDYRAHQRRLLPRLADSYAVDFAHTLSGASVSSPAPRRTRARSRPWRRGSRPTARGTRRHAAGLPRGLRRPGLPAGQPHRRPEGRHRRLHHLRGRQHGAAAAGRQGPADPLPPPVHRSAARRAGALPGGARRPGPGRAQSGRPAPHRRASTCATATSICAPCATARSAC